MSVIVKLQDIPATVANKFDRWLTVVSKDPKANNNFGNGAKNFSYHNQVRVQAFESFESGSPPVKYICLPFSFYYHHCSSIPKQTLFANHTYQTSMKFKGDLLPRQQQIKDEAVEILGRTGSILLCLHTGFGKTIFALYLAARIGLKTIVLCHRAIIMQQWVDSASRYLPGSKCEIFEPSKVKKQNGDLNAAYGDVNVLVCNVINVPKFPREFFATFGLCIVDEVHTVCTQQFSKALHSLVPSYLIGLSATPFRTDGMDRLLELYLGPEMIERKMHRFFNAYKLATKFTPTIEEQSTIEGGGLNWNAVLESQATSQTRNMLICKLVYYFSHRVILILVKRKDHALKLKKMLQTLGVDVDCFIHTDKTVNYDCKVLIATYSKGGVGFDHPKLNMLITGADVEENFMQYLGRIFRRDDTVPIYIDLRDDLPTLVKHSQSRLAVCKEVGGIVKEFEKTFKSFADYTQVLDSNLKTIA